MPKPKAALIIQLFVSVEFCLSCLARSQDKLAYYKTTGHWHLMNVRAALRGIRCPIRWEFEEERLSSIMRLSTSFSLLKVPSQSSHLCAVSPVQSVGNLRLARTRVCQMFPFTSYNPLAHHQSTNLNCHVNTFFAPPRKIFTSSKNSC